MGANKLSIELEAFQRLTKALQDLEDTRLFFERANLSFPEPLKRMLGVSENGSGSQNLPGGSIPEPKAPPMPSGVGDDWIWISAKDAGLTSIALALLRQQQPLRPGELMARINKILPNASSGGLANTGTRLDGDIIERGADGWVLKRPEKAPILEGSYLWGPPDIFVIQELAAHRRDAILHLLGQVKTGLETVQIVERLSSCPWVRAPINKDLVQDDVKRLSLIDKRIRRRGNTRKWELTPKGDEETACSN